MTSRRSWPALYSRALAVDFTAAPRYLPWTFSSRRSTLVSAWNGSPPALSASGPQSLASGWMTACIGRESLALGAPPPIFTPPVEVTTLDSVSVEDETAAPVDTAGAVEAAGGASPEYGIGD